MAELFRHWLANGTADRVARAQRVEATARQALAREVLGRHRYHAQPASYHLWLPLPPPWRTAELIAAVRDRGVALDPGSSFAIDPANAPHAARVSLSVAASRERLSRALTVLAETLDTAPARRRDVI
jgi:DNA-binding transcriptional MocR family regulator